MMVLLHTSKCRNGVWCTANGFIKQLCRAVQSSQPCASKIQKDSGMARIRNIGIMAHIDAGKTTTTERMLYYSGCIATMGEVHHGNTVTDYMEQERNRGITITSAAVTFGWRGVRVNLVDTPGHIDFTMEVEQALNIMDGGIVVLDGSAGVEAQTVTVWHQADRYGMPRLVYVNKMDRLDANLELCIESLHSKLGVCPLPLQIPVKDKGRLRGLLDLVGLQECLWTSDGGGERYATRVLCEAVDGALWERAVEARARLTEAVADLDDQLAEMVIGLESVEKVSPEQLAQAVRRCTLASKGVPVLAGSSYKNIGVQLLMCAVVDYLPSPLDCHHLRVFRCFGDALAARSFKVVHHDRQKGPVTFLRLYSGRLTKGQKVYNMSRSKMEQISRLMVVTADDFEEVSEVTEGNIAAVTGLKYTMTGDLVSSSISSAATATKQLSRQLGVVEGEVADRFGVSPRVPDPVFFRSIEPPSQAYQSALDNALIQLQREDPSLRVSNDSETGQTVLAGMGELHLEIIKDRIVTEFKIDVDLGPLQIAYKEAPLTTIRDTHAVSHTIGSSKQSVSVTLTVGPAEGREMGTLSLDRSPDSAANIDAIHPKVMQAVRAGVKSALSHGPKLGCTVIDSRVVLHWLEVGRGTSDTIVSATVAQCITKILVAGGTCLLEPIMAVEVVTDEDRMPAVLADLSRRRGSIQQISMRGNNKVVAAEVPLSELLGYSKTLRTFTSGTAAISMEFSLYRAMNAVDEANAVASVQGL